MIEVSLLRTDSALPGLLLSQMNHTLNLKRSTFTLCSIGVGFPCQQGSISRLDISSLAWGPIGKFLVFGLPLPSEVVRKHCSTWTVSLNDNETKSEDLFIRTRISTQDCFKRFVCVGGGVGVCVCRKGERVCVCVCVSLILP
jgi:hypothetical protein